MKTTTFHRRPLDICDVCGEKREVSVFTDYVGEKIIVRRICKECGLSKYYKPLETWRDLRETIFKRDNDECVICGLSRFEKCVWLELHHTKYPRKMKKYWLGKSNDFMTLCKGCHHPLLIRKNGELYKEYNKMRLKKGDVIKNKKTEKMREKIIGENIKILVRWIDYYVNKKWKNQNIKIPIDTEGMPITRDYKIIRCKHGTIRKISIVSNELRNMKLRLIGRIRKNREYRRIWEKKFKRYENLLLQKLNK